jgi:hypothetical protein
MPDAPVAETSLDLSGIDAFSWTDENLSSGVAPEWNKAGRAYSRIDSHATNEHDR